jgi:hypothetical protein
MPLCATRVQVKARTCIGRGRAEVDGGKRVSAEEEGGLAGFTNRAVAAGLRREQFRRRSPN